MTLTLIYRLLVVVREVHNLTDEASSWHHGYTASAYSPPYLLH